MKTLLLFSFLFAFSFCYGQTFTEDTVLVAQSITAQGANMDGDTDIDIVYVDAQGDVFIAEKLGVDNYTHHNVDSGHHIISTIRLADIDNDLDIDIIVGSYLDSITILENLGSFTFSRTAYFIGQYVCDLEVAHFNGDNLIDIVATARQDNAVFVLENSASGFIIHQIATSYLASKVDTADFNGDGDIDFVVAGIHGSSGAGQIEWYENNGNFTFTSHTISTAGNYDVFARDLDGDTDIDIVTANTFNGEISYWLNNGSNSFTKTVIHQLTCCALSIWAEDMNNDGFVDIISGDEEYGGVLLHTNDGALNFTTSAVGLDYDTYEFDILDEDFDGDMDIIAASYSVGPGVSLFRNSLLAVDLIAPVPDLLSLSDVPAECSVTSLVAPTATDNIDGSVTGTHDATLPINTQGTTLVTWTYVDGNGNSTMQTQNVVITDVSAPIVDNNSLTAVTSECDVTNLIAPTATDNCIGSVTGIHNATLPINTQGTTVVTWTYDDGNGNSSTQTQNVVITDVSAPIADNNSLTAVTSECEVTNLIAPTATDNCIGSVTGTHNASLPINTQGTTVVTWTYDDGLGNTSTQSQDVVITDVIDPIADLANLSSITSECEVTNLIEPTASDNCSGTITGTHNASLPITTSGTTVVTWTYDDGNGNTTTQIQNVIITPIDNGITQVDAVTVSADASGYNYQWVDCDNGNTPVQGATNQTFSPTMAGNYACEIDNGTCTVTTACLASSVGIIENSFGTEFVVYPNPTFGNLKVVLGKVYNGTTVKVFNALGQVVINESFGATDEISLNINGKPGMYILEIKTKDGKMARVNVIKK